MNDSMAIPTNGFQVVDPVGSTVRTVFPVMRLQRPARPTACTAPAGSFHYDSAVQKIHPLDDRS